MQLIANRPKDILHTDCTCPRETVAIGRALLVPANEAVVVLSCAGALVVPVAETEVCGAAPEVSTSPPARVRSSC